MKFKQHDIQDALRGTEDYHALMRSITVSALRAKSGYIPPKENPDNFSELTFSASLLRWFYSPSSPSIFYVLQLGTEQPICAACLWQLTRFANRPGRRASVNFVFDDIFIGEMCVICTEECLKIIPF